MDTIVVGIPHDFNLKSVIVTYETMIDNQFKLYTDHRTVRVKVQQRMNVVQNEIIVMFRRSTVVRIITLGFQPICIV